MSIDAGVNHCLSDFMRCLDVSDRAATTAKIDALPEVCPHDDCTGLRNCKQNARNVANAQVRFMRNLAMRKRAA